MSKRGMRRDREWERLAVAFTRDAFIELCSFFTTGNIAEIKGLDRAKRAMRAFSFHTIPKERFDALAAVVPDGLWTVRDEIWEKTPLLDAILDGEVPVSRNCAEILRLGCYLNCLCCLWSERIGQDGYAEYSHRNLVFKGKRAAGKVEKAGRELGLDKDVHAYLQGIPLEDVIGGTPYRRRVDAAKIVEKAEEEPAMSREREEVRAPRR